MRYLTSQTVRVVTAGILATILSIPQNLTAQAHVVSPHELQQQTVAAGETRSQNVETLRSFLSLPQAEKAMKAVHTDPGQVTTAVAQLSDRELAQLAARAQKAESDFAAGNITDHDLLIIMIIVLIVVVIIVADHH